jgi:nucleotide-binding universal stress UspA family protein
VREVWLRDIHWQSTRGIDMQTQPKLKNGQTDGLQRVLVASDLTAYADRALDRAAILARSGAVVRLVHAFDSRLLPDEYLETNVQEAEDLLQKDLRESGLDENFDLSASVAIGNAEDSILEEARSIKADMIVMASSRDASPARVVRGTIVDRVVRGAPCPVLVVRSRARRPYAEILVLIDLTAPSRLALDYALQRFPNAHTTILHVDEEAVSDAKDFAPRDERRHQIEDMVAARCQAAGLPQPGSSGGPTVRVLGGNIVDLAQAEIRKTEPNLVVMGTHGRSVMASFFRGSIAETLLEISSQDVLVVRS